MFGIGFPRLCNTIEEFVLNQTKIFIIVKAAKS